MLHPWWLHPCECTPKLHLQCMHPNTPSLLETPSLMHPDTSSPVITPQCTIPAVCTPKNAPQNFTPAGCTPCLPPNPPSPANAPQWVAGFGPAAVSPSWWQPSRWVPTCPRACLGSVPMGLLRPAVPRDQGHGGGGFFPPGAPKPGRLPSSCPAWAGWELPAAPATQFGKAGLAGTATVPERVGTGGVGEGERRPPGTRWVAAGALGAFWHQHRHRHRSHLSPAPQSSAPPTRAPCRMPSCWRRVRGLRGQGGHTRVPPRVGPPSQPSISPTEETRLPGPATPRGSPSPEEPPEGEGSGPPPASSSPWCETSLDRPYEKAKKPGFDPGDGETRGSRCYPGSPPAIPATPSAPGSPDPTASLAPRTGDVPPYRFVPIRTLVLCRQAGSSAPSTPEPSGRRGQSQSLRYPGEPRGRSAVPRRRPTYYTVTVPTACIPTPGPACRSGSDDSISDLSSISHATSPGSSSPDVSFPRPKVPPPLAEPGYYPRGAHRFLPPASPPAFLYEQDLAPLRYQRLVPSHSRIVRTPSLKDYAPAGGRGLSKAAVTEELKSWHQRARLRGARPHSLDRQGAFRGPRGGTTRDVPITRGVLPRTQVGHWVLGWGSGCGRVEGNMMPIPLW
uniref:Innate immunity activator n=1 Tax=Falco tinnunculus TaxID=100819 RepID=A0A8C4UPS7_FALTI